MMMMNEYNSSNFSKPKCRKKMKNENKNKLKEYNINNTLKNLF